MKNIGQANVFHEFLVFPRFLADPRRFSGKPQIHGKHWPGQCFPLFFHRNSWKTLARPMFSMNFLVFPRFLADPRRFLWKTTNSWKTLARPMFSIVFFIGIHGKHWPGQCFP